MEFGRGGACRAAQCIALVAVIAAAPSANAGSRLGGHYEFGVGAIRTRPYVVGGGICATLAGGLSARLAAPLTACIELQATAGTNFPLMGTLEAASAGHQSLTTVVAALEVHGLPHARGSFLSAGLGAGRSKTSGARGPLSSSNFGEVTLRNRTALAYGLGLGYRFAGGGSRMRLALRTHGLLREGFDSSSYATVVALGVAY